VAIRVTIRGTHHGVFHGIAPTGKSVSVSLVEIVRLEEGKIAESWGGVDPADVLHQLGAVVFVDPDIQ
jgi:predicted ester cyclase